MNLHAIVSGAIGAVNPFVSGTVRASNGFTAGPGARQVPAYHPDVTGVPMQVQPLSPQDLRFLDGMNLTNVERAVYLNGVINGVDRKIGLGGDLLIFGGDVWLVRVCIEPWNLAGWCKLGVAKQLDPP